jgi:hypothetical protein
MRRKTVLGALAAFFAGVVVCLAADPNMGTWKLNEAKSKFDPAGTKNTMVVYEAAGDAVKVTVDGVGADGKAVHSVWTGKYDGKDYAVVGDPTSDMRSYKMAGANTLELTGKKDGKVTVTGKIVMAADGKSRTVSTTATTADGKKMSNTAVYEKQ